LYWHLRNMDYLCTAHGVVHIRIGWHRLVPDHPFFNPMSKIRFANYPKYYYTISLDIYRYFRYNYIVSEYNRY
jgi:hypothetical protein